MQIATSIFNSPVFKGNFSGNLQGLIDNSLPALYSQSIWRNYMKWGIEQTELTFDTVIGRRRIEAAASIVDIDAPAPLRGHGKLEVYGGKIPTMKEKFRLDQKDYRALVALQEKNIGAPEVKQQLIDMLYDDVSKSVTSTDKRLDIMFLQGVSTFKIDIAVLNNPDGAAYGDVDLLAAVDQTRTVVKVWTDPTSDPLADIDAVVTYAANTGRTFKEIWIDREKWLQIKSYAAVKSAISGYMNPGSNNKFIVTLDIVNEYLVANGLPPFRIVNERRGIEKDGLITTINPFKKENVVFMPEGNLGTVHNAWAVESKQAVEGYTYARYDRTLLKKYRSSDPWTEWTEVELNAFPAFEGIDGLFIMKTDVAS